MNSLVFITSSTSKVPSGRNARRHDQAERARSSHPVTEQDGQFLIFDLKTLDADNQVQEVRKRRRKAGRPDNANKHMVPTYLEPSLPNQPTADISLLRSTWLAAMSHDFQDVLAIAAHHVRRTAAQIAYTQPWRMAEILRGRQWAVAPFTFQQLQKSESVTSAYTFLVMRLQSTVFDRGTSALSLAGNQWALRSLQTALLRQTGKTREALVPAAWLLALGELLDFQRSTSWSTHAAGTAALLRAGLSSGQQKPSPDMQELMPTLLEACLNHEDVAVRYEPWQAFIRPMIASRISDGALANYVASRLITVAALIPERQALHENSGSEAGQAGLLLMDRAFDAREFLKRAIVKIQLQDKRDSDILGLCLAALLGLDKVIASLRLLPPDVEHRYADDTTELCLQIMREELKRSDAGLDLPLLLAFKRHGTLSALMPSTDL